MYIVGRELFSKIGWYFRISLGIWNSLSITVSGIELRRWESCCSDGGNMCRYLKTIVFSVITVEKEIFQCAFFKTKLVWNTVQFVVR